MDFTSFDNAQGSIRPWKTALPGLMILFFCFVVPRSEARPHAAEAIIVTSPEVVKTRVQGLGLGAEVKVSTVFGHKRYRGYITRIDQESFEVTDVAAWRANTLNYSVVSRILGRPLPDPDAPTEKRRVRALFNVLSRFGVGP